MADSDPKADTLIKDTNDAPSGVDRVVTPPPEEEEVMNVEKLKDGNNADTSSAQLASREASMRVADNKNNEPPPIDKKALLGLITVYFSVFLDMMGISIVQPVLPFYAEKFNANSFELGALYSSYSLMATFASYAMGKASDRFGRRPSILFSLFGTMVGFTVTGFATDYGSLLAYRFLTGAFGGSAPIAQAYITDVVPSTQRPKYLAFTGATAALSFIIGPGLGSGLSTFGIRIPFFVSGALGGFGLIFAYFSLHESHPRMRNSKKNDDVTKDDESPEVNVSGSSSPNGSAHSPVESTDLNLKTHMVDDSIPKQVWILAFLNIFNMMGWTSYTSMFAYYVILKYELSTLAIGYITLSLATLYVFTNIVIFSKLSKMVGTYMCTFYGLLIFSIFLGILPLFDELWLTLLCIGIGAGLGNGMVFPAMSAMAADYTTPTNRGKILAFSNAAQNIGMVIGPLFHGIIFEVEPDLVFYSASAFVFCAWICIIVLIVENPLLRKPLALRVQEEERMKNLEDGVWKFMPDNPTDEDYRKLGKFLGKLLSKRNYRWVSYYDRMTQFLKDIFPELRTETLEEHIEDIQFLRSNVSNMRTEYDAAHASHRVQYA